MEIFSLIVRTPTICVRVPNRLMECDSARFTSH